MPNPKAGTVTMDVTKAINDIKAGKIEYRLDKTNIIHVPIGKASFTEEQLADNFQTLIDAIIKAKPAAVKGQYLKSVTLTSTMGPGVKVNPVKLCIIKCKRDQLRDCHRWRVCYSADPIMKKK